MLFFLIGIFSFISFVLYCLCRAAGEADRDMEETMRKWAEEHKAGNKISSK